MVSQTTSSKHTKTSVDEENNLFIIENAIDIKLIEDFNKEDVSLYETAGVAWQDNYPRKKLIPYQNSTLEKIKEQLIERFECNDVAFWLDSEGFYMGPHIDNPGVKTAMQIYIGNARPELGTVFYQVTDDDVYDDDTPQKWRLQKTQDLEVRYDFRYIPNTGYLSINGRLQAHGLQARVGADDFRVSAYCYF
jgi:hypothetical protein